MTASELLSGPSPSENAAEMSALQTLTKNAIQVPRCPNSPRNLHGVFCC